MGDQQYNAARTAAGRAIYARIGAILPQLQGMSTKAAQDAISKIAEQEHATAKANYSSPVLARAEF
jgi:hypothetical protein